MIIFFTVSKYISIPLIYKGCIYNTTNATTLELEQHEGIKPERLRPIQCNDRDGCNPASKTQLDLFIASLSTVLFCGLAHFWKLE